MFGPSINEIIEKCGISTDSRSIKEGQAFLALRGEKFDGHVFVDKAFEKGAAIAIVDSNFNKGNLKGKLIVVEDTLKAYQDIGKFWRNKFNIPVIAVTGSAGKTTTKELISALLSKSGKVLKTAENFNNDIGVAKTLLELRSEHSYAVIEMGMRGKGEIARLSAVAQPTIAVITNAGRAHIERLGSEEAIARAKCEIVEGLAKDGTLIFDHDNELLRRIVSEVWHNKITSFGLQAGDVQGNFLEEKSEIVVNGTTYPLPLEGKHNAMNFLATMAVADAVGIDRAMLSNLEVELPSGRGGRIELANDIILLDETYNASPEAMLSSLELLKSMKGVRKVAVLGEMRELGEFSLALHRSVGEKALALGLDEVCVLIDSESGQALFDAITSKHIHKKIFSDKKELISYLKESLRAGDRVLFKAAHSVGLETVVAELKQALA